MMTFKHMATIVPEAELGNVKIDHSTPTQLDAMLEGMHGRTLDPRKVHTRLFIDDFLVMSDGDHERRTNLDAVYHATGNVLIAGLGLGYILHPILAKPNVASVTVVEINPHVIALIQPTLPAEKLTVIEADIYAWRPSKGTKFDTIYFDIWPEVSTDALVEMAQLHMAFKFYKAKGGWMNSWERDYLRYRKRQEQAAGW